MASGLSDSVRNENSARWRLNSFTLKASSRHRGFESQTLVSLSLFVEDKIVQQAHWANNIAVEEHEHVVIKLASDSDSSSDIYTSRLPEGQRNFIVLNSNIW